MADGNNRAGGTEEGNKNYEEYSREIGLEGHGMCAPDSRRLHRADRTGYRFQCNSSP